MSTVKTGKKPTTNAFAAASDALGLGVDALFSVQGTGNEYDADINLDDIEIVAQVRTDFEDDANSLADLGKSLRRRQLQNIVVCLNLPGREKPYLLIAGERRVRAAKLEKLSTLRARVFEMTQEEMDEAQFIENIHRKNLTQIEEAKRVQRDLDAAGGDVEVVLAKYNKGRPWLSKILALLTLSKETSRLVTQGISSDIEVINQVKTIEKADPVKAKVLVDKLAEGRGKVNARAEVAKVKDEVKPPKAKPAGGGAVATPKDRSIEEPTNAKVFSGAKDSKLTAKQLLAGAYSAIFDGNKRPATVLEAMTPAERELATAWLQDHFDAGKKVKDIGRVVINGMRSGVYSTDGEGALALVALLNGAEGGVKFDLLNIFGAVK